MATNTTPFLNEIWQGEGWTDGWDVATPYAVNGGTFILLLKTNGFGADDRNVHIHPVLPDGRLAPRVFSNAWGEGWTTARAYDAAEGPRLFLLKAQGQGEDGRNVHIHPLEADGSVG